LGAGFLPGTLSVILAAQGIGKSLLMTDLISGIFVNTKNVLLVSLEMQDSEIMKRVHANSMDLPINSLIDLSKTEKELNELNRRVVTKEQIIEAHARVKAQGNCGKLFIKNYPAGSFSPLMLEQLIESFKIEKNIEFDIVFVDYLGIMKSDLLTPSAGLYSYLKSIGEEVRAVADKQKVPIVSANQLNRCFCPDSYIQTDKGPKQAKDIVKGDKVLSNAGYNTVMGTVNTGTQKTYKIKTKSGKEFICSGDHKFPTEYGTMTINVGLEPGIKLCTTN